MVKKKKERENTLSTKKKKLIFFLIVFLVESVFSFINSHLWRLLSGCFNCRRTGWSRRRPPPTYSTSCPLCPHRCLIWRFVASLARCTWAAQSPTSSLTSTHSNSQPQVRGPRPARHTWSIILHRQVILIFLFLMSPLMIDWWRGCDDGVCQKYPWRDYQQVRINWINTNISYETLLKCLRPIKLPLINRNSIVPLFSRVLTSIVENPE